MQIGTATDLNTKPEEVYIVMVLLNKKLPRPCKLSEKALQGYLAEKSLNHTEQADLTQLQQCWSDGKNASKQIGQYVDWLLSTYNPDPPDNGTWIKPTIHPCQRRHRDIVVRYL